MQRVVVERIGFVPAAAVPSARDIARLQECLARASSLVVLTGAGVSTESGIPDYRSAGVGRYARSDRRPVQYQQFVKSSKVRQGFWARNFAGWSTFRAFEPNDTHFALAEWEKRDKVKLLITQNVDRLHQKAGSSNVCELHGTNYNVLCMHCHQMHCRDHIQQVIISMNPQFNAQMQEVAPDGDVDIAESAVSAFRPPECPDCGCESLRPNVVFFGDNVPRPIVQQCRDAVDNADALLLLGTTVETMSCLRYVKQSMEQGTPVYSVNIGPTRADAYYAHKIDARCSLVVPHIKLT